MRTSEEKTLATGDVIQTVNGARVTSELLPHFFDGSLYEETTVFEQRSVFRLVSDRLRQEGPSFPNPMDAIVDISGKGEEKSYQLKIPDDAANGLLFIIMKNLPTLDSDTSVSLATTSSKPRIVKFHIRPSGT